MLVHYSAKFVTLGSNVRGALNYGFSFELFDFWDFFGLLDFPVLNFIFLLFSEQTIDTEARGS